MKKMTCVASLVAVLGMGCGGDDGGGGISEGPSVAQGTADVQAMNSSAAQADTLNKALASGSGESVAGSALQLSSAGMTAVKGGGQALTQALTAVNAETGTTGTKTCTATGCVFDKYGAGGFTMTGSVTATDVAGGGKKVVWSLDGTLDASATNSNTSGFGDIKFTYNWKGDITVSATSIQGAAGGTWKGSGTTMGQSFTFDYGSLIKFESVVLTNSCVTGGSITAKWWAVVKAGSQSQTQGAQGTHTFTSCSR